MSRIRAESVRAAFAVFLLTATTCFSVIASADDVPPSVIALFPAGTTFGHGDWSVIETEFGTTFGGDLYASSFNGQKPSCDFAALPKIDIHLKGDTSFEEPPMLDMVVQQYEQDLAGAAKSMSGFVSSYTSGAPNVVSVGKLQDEQLPNGRLMYVEFKEDCSAHPNGAKTKLRGFARRGATMLDFELMIALDSEGTKKIANEILANFDKLDIAALVK